MMFTAVPGRRVLTGPYDSSMTDGFAWKSTNTHIFRHLRAVIWCHPSLKCIVLSGAHDPETSDPAATPDFVNKLEMSAL